MQEIHDLSMTSGGGGGGIVSGGGSGGTGRFYGGGIGDRRMRAHQTILNHHQSLKCPRCNSLNTKFCYYNNYNLSQPRHFCKNCRRYWTKGGVLRNVPVGGGCRKAKRSKSKQLSVDKSRDGEEKEEEEEEEDKDRKSSSHSSSESSSLTTVAAAASVSAEGFLNLPGNGIEWSTLLSSNGGGFTEEIIGFNETTPFGLGGNSVNDQYRGETTSLVDNSEQNAVGFEPLDWGSNGGDQTLFDLTSTVDHTYWSQSQWTTSDQDDQIGLYLP